MPLPPPFPARPDRATAQASTLKAAQAAKDAGLIDKSTFASMTDGTVSLQDLDIATDLRREHRKSLINALSERREDGPGHLSDRLFEAINVEIDAQGDGRTILESLKDLF